MATRAALIVLSIYVFGHWLAGLSLAVLFLVWALLKAKDDGRLPPAKPEKASKKK